MLKYLSLMVIGFSVAEINKCKDNFKCIPLNECEEIKSLIESNSLIDYIQSFSCGYFHEPYICCARDCKTPNGNYGNLVTLMNCPSLKQNEYTHNTNKKEFLKDSFVNETHVCCRKNEDEHKVVAPAPIDDTGLQTDALNVSCTTPNGDYANCTHIYDCPSYLKAAAEPNDYFRFINDSICGYWKEPMVCCGKVSYYKESFANNLPGKCGSWNTTLHRNIAPWLVVISTIESADLCVGALINHQYVISTVLCTGKDRKKLSVRFGACIQNKHFNNQCAVKVKQLKLFPLQNFVDSQDIGIVLLKLVRPVSPDIIPICLPNSQLPISQQLEVIGLKYVNKAIINDKQITAFATYTDDCYFGTNLRYVCMNSDNINIIYNQIPQQYMVIRSENSNWYLEGLFNWKSWDQSIATNFHAIYIHKFSSWIKSNIS